MRVQRCARSTYPFSFTEPSPYVQQDIAGPGVEAPRDHRQGKDRPAFQAAIEMERDSWVQHKCVMAASQEEYRTKCARWTKRRVRWFGTGACDTGAAFQEATSS